MKHLIITLFTLTSSLLTLHAAIPLRWTVETSRAQPATFEAYQGETLALEAALQSYGKPLEAPSNYSLYWQTNGMGSTYWSVPCVATASSPSNVLFATWSPTNDVGARAYNCFIGKPGTIYHAAFQLRLRPSPGATPNELPLPQKVIDFAKVTVLNPPWSGGGGGGVDTNAVIDIIHRTVDGSARTLPPYLHYLEMDDTYPEAAAEWYAQADYSHGSCSARRTGNLLERNYDWNFDFMPEFVVRCVATASSPSCPGGRFASIAVCNVGTSLTEDSVTSGKWSKWYKALPGHAVDGINENGVVCEVNVCPTNGVEGWTGTDVHCLGGVRYALDHATNAAHAASLLAEKVYVPKGYGNFHYMIADATSTYIVENGDAHPVPSSLLEGAVLTNFRLYPTRDTSGEGQERYDALASGASITSQWWTLTYTPDGYRASDLQGLDTNLLFSAWAATPKESHRGETFHSPTPTQTSNSVWWQTVHTSVYDITNRTLRICVQETPDWYTFTVPEASSPRGVDEQAVREIVGPMIEVHHDDTKADKSELSGKLDTSFEFAGIGTGYIRWEAGFLSVYSPMGVYSWGGQLASVEAKADGSFGRTHVLSEKADSATTLSGYGITDGATKTELAAKQDALPYPTNAIPASVITGLEPPSSPFLRVYDEIRHCWWLGKMVNGVINWEVE